MAKKKICATIGGQAVLEGVMMRGKSATATAVRDQNGKIVVESNRFKPLSERSVLYRIPIIRGVLSFAQSMVEGIKTINRSSEVFTGMENEEPSKFERWLAKKFNVDVMSVLVSISVLLGIVLAVALFVVLPHLATEGINKLVLKLSGSELHRILINLIAGVIRIIIFILYVVLISQMKDIKRLFMYHGAEHKVISCFENGLDLTVENAQKMTTVHDRCGTTFIFIVMVFSILFFSFDVFSQNVWQRILIRIAFIPLVAGISYELLKLFAKFDNVFTRICKAPGLALQKLTTRQPDDSMVEVSIKAFNTVMELEKNPDMPTETFITYTTVEKAVKELCSIVSTENEAELILMHFIGANTRTELYDGRRVQSELKQKAMKCAKKRASGAPLQYVIGEANFYGLDFVVDQRVLIPRFDTEILAKTAIDLASKLNEPKILDLCTGSGAIAITVKANVACEMTATDVSPDAIAVAEQNANKHGVDIMLKIGSLFKPVKGSKFDIICCNPPYIPTKDINGLDAEVKEYEPHIALDGGIDGLDIYRDVTAQAGKHLTAGGYLLMEVGANQAEQVTAMLDDYDVSYAYDLNTPPIARVIIAKYKKQVEAEDGEVSVGDNPIVENAVTAKEKE